MLLHLLISAFIASIALMLLFPRTPAAKAIRRVLVEKPARFLTDFAWAKAGRLALSIVAVGAMMMMPEMAMLTASLGADAAILEVMIIVWVASASGGVASAWRSMRQAGVCARRIAMRMGRAAGRPRAPRHRRSRPPHGRKDDVDRPEWAFAQGPGPLRHGDAILTLALDQGRSLRGR